MEKIKKCFENLLIIIGFFTLLWLIIHRRVVMSWLTGSEMPEMPEWHKKFLHK